MLPGAAGMADENGFDTVDAVGWTGATNPPRQQSHQTSTKNPKSLKAKGVDDVTSDAVEYKMNHRFRGTALIISNQSFEGGIPERKGTAVDTKTMENTLRKLGFEVATETDMTSDELRATLMSHARDDHSDRDCFVCVIMTHGTEDHILGTCGNKISLTTLISFFGGDRCPSLRGKPKIFILNACQGESVDPGHTVADAMGFRDTRDTEQEQEEDIFQNLPYELDFLYIQSTVHGYYSFRSPTKGSPFINSLCAVLEKYGNELEICKVLTLVNRKVAVEFTSKNGAVQYNDKKQCPCFLSLLTRQLYLGRRPKKI